MWSKRHEMVPTETAHKQCISTIYTVILFLSLGTVSSFLLAPWIIQSKDNFLEKMKKINSVNISNMKLGH